MEPAGARKANAVPSADRKTAPRGSWAIWTNWMFILLAVYLLSVGPAARLHRDVPATRPVIETVYAPMEPLFDCDPLENVIRWYLVKVWRLPTD